MHSCSLVVFTLGTCMHTYMLYCRFTCVQQVCMPCSINRGVHLEGIQGEQHQLWSLSVNTTHLFVYLLSFLLSLRSIRDSLEPRNNRTGGGERKATAVLRTHADTQKPQQIETTKRDECVYIYIQMNGVTTGRPVSDKALLPTRTHTENEMETLPEALRRYAEQSQPPESLHNRSYRTMEEKRSVPVRHHFVLHKGDPFLSLFPLFYRSRRGPLQPVTSLYSLSFRTEILLDFLAN